MTVSICFHMFDNLGEFAIHTQKKTINCEKVLMLMAEHESVIKHYISMKTNCTIFVKVLTTNDWINRNCLQM